MLFTNRELSFLAFNQRVLEEAGDETVPLLERLKFVAIVSANLDEFSMVRVAGLKQQLKSGVLETGPDGMLPTEQLKAIAKVMAEQYQKQAEVLQDSILPELQARGVEILKVDDLSPPERDLLGRHFRDQIFPILTPLAVDPGHPFPFLKNRTLNLAVRLLPNHAPSDAAPLLAVVQVPTIPRFVSVGRSTDFSAVFVEDLIAHHIGELFPGMRIIECVPLRVIRNWDLFFDEDAQEDLLETVQKELQRRWRLDTVLLHIDDAASNVLVEELVESLALHPNDLQRHRGPLALADLEDILEDIGRSDLRDPPFRPVLGTDFHALEDYFLAIKKRDILLHHPYESYEPVVELLAQAAEDPAVLAIKQTLYRTNRDSPILKSLVRAAENGKQVTALVELKARFDEERNVEWAQILEDAGANVVYGLIGLKTHCKVTLVVRREQSGITNYVHLGTGNYNEKTAKVYSDLSLFSARQEVGEDVSALFNLLTGYSEPPRWKRLVVAPLGLRKRILSLIAREKGVAEKGEPAKIIIKSNAVIDPKTIRALCDASQAGVDVTLLVRGPCTIKLGIPGLSDKLKVCLLVDRFLEHSRILYFAHHDVEDVFITSTDIMPRNFDRRIEVALPILDPLIKRRLVDEILATEMQDNQKLVVLDAEGQYQRVRRRGRKLLRAQERFIELAKKRAKPRPKKRKALGVR